MEKEHTFCWLNKFRLCSKSQISQKLSLIKFFLAWQTNLSSKWKKTIGTFSDSPEACHISSCWFLDHHIRPSLLRTPDTNALMLSAIPAHLSEQSQNQTQGLEMGVHAGVTFLTPATNPEGSPLTTLSKISPSSLWVTLVTHLFCTMFLHSTCTTWNCILASLVIIYLPKENTNAVRARTLSLAPSSTCWLNEWLHSV